MIRLVFYYSKRFLRHPLLAAEEVAADERALAVGFWWNFLFYLAYSLLVLILYLLGHAPLHLGFLSVSREKWYLVQTFTTLPVGFAGILSLTGLAYMLARVFKGKGSFDATFASLSFTFILPCVLLMLIPEALLGPLLILLGRHTMPWPGWVENLRVFIIPLPWAITASVFSFSRLHRIPVGKSLVAVLVAAVPMIVIMAVFIR